MELSEELELLNTEEILLDELSELSELEMLEDSELLSEELELLDSDEELELLSEELELLDSDELLEESELDELLDSEELLLDSELLLLDSELLDNDELLVRTDSPPMTTRLTLDTVLSPRMLSDLVFTFTVYVPGGNSPEQAYIVPTYVSFATSIDVSCSTTSVPSMLIDTEFADPISVCCVS